jgi:hypothetical protein
MSLSSPFLNQSEDIILGRENIGSRNPSLAVFSSMSKQVPMYFKGEFGK